MHGHRLMNQVVIHGNGRQKRHDPVAQELSQGQHGQGQADRQGNHQQRQGKAPQHLPGLNAIEAGGRRLGLQQAHQPPQRQRRHGRGQGFPQDGPADAAPLLHQPHIEDRPRHAHRVHIQEGGQLVDHHAVFIHGPQAVPPVGKGRGGHAAQGGRRAAQGQARQKRKQQVGLHFHRQGPAGHAHGGGHVGFHVKGKGEGEVHEQILHHLLRRGIQPPGQRHREEQQQRVEVVAGHHPHDPPAVERPGIRQLLSKEHGAGIGQKQQKPAEQDGAVHRHIARPHQKVQRHPAYARGQPALLPDMIPADDEHQQHPQPVQLRNALCGGSKGLALHVMLPHRCPRPARLPPSWAEGWLRTPSRPPPPGSGGFASPSRPAGRRGWPPCH